MSIIPCGLIYRLCDLTAEKCLFLCLTDCFFFFFYNIHLIIFNHVFNETKTCFVFCRPLFTLRHSLFSVLLCHFSSPPPCLKSFEGHPGAQWVDVMSANEPIDNLTIGWLVLQALTMCSTETFLAQALSLLDLCPTLPSIWAYKGCSESLMEKLHDVFIFQCISLHF